MRFQSFSHSKKLQIVYYQLTVKQKSYKRKLVQELCKCLSESTSSTSTTFEGDSDLSEGTSSTSTTFEGYSDLSESTSSTFTTFEGDSDLSESTSSTFTTFEGDSDLSESTSSTFTTFEGDSDLSESTSSTSTTFEGDSDLSESTSSTFATFEGDSDTVIYNVIETPSVKVDVSTNTTLSRLIFIQQIAMWGNKENKGNILTLASIIFVIHLALRSSEKICFPCD